MDRTYRYRPCIQRWWIIYLVCSIHCWVPRRLKWNFSSFCFWYTRQFFLGTLWCTEIICRFCGPLGYIFGVAIFRVFAVLFFIFLKNRCCWPTFLNKNCFWFLLRGRANPHLRGNSSSLSASIRQEQPFSRVDTRAIDYLADKDSPALSKKNSNLSEKIWIFFRQDRIFCK